MPVTATVGGGHPRALPAQHAEDDLVRYWLEGRAGSMSKHDEALLGTDVRPCGHQPLPTPRRINVAVSATMLAAIDRVIEREHVTLTEAVRRLITYGDFVYRTAKVESGVLLVRLPDGSEREVVLV